MKYCDNIFASSTYRLIDTSTMDPLLDTRDKTEVFILHRYSVIVKFLDLVSCCVLCKLFQVVEKKKSPLYPDLKDEDGENEREMLNSDGKVEDEKETETKLYIFYFHCKWDNLSVGASKIFFETYPKYSNDHCIDHWLLLCI